MEKNDHLKKDKGTETNNGTQSTESQQEVKDRAADNKKEGDPNQEEIETELKIHEAQTERD